jgi:acyl-CoA reductase-like NAD-dependent aldehyde dehydrogenase
VVWANTYNKVRSRQPFGGYKESVLAAKAGPGTCGYVGLG